jgi:hypothetical protein
MEPLPAVEFIKISTFDTPRLIVLKSQYNRCAARFNTARFNTYGEVSKNLMVQLKYLKEQIDLYD